MGEEESAAQPFTQEQQEFHFGTTGRVIVPG